LNQASAVLVEEIYHALDFLVARADIAPHTLCSQRCDVAPLVVAKPESFKALQVGALATGS
jgi:hypothetical protein